MTLKIDERVSRVYICRNGVRIDAPWNHFTTRQAAEKELANVRPLHRADQFTIVVEVIKAKIYGYDWSTNE